MFIRTSANAATSAPGGTLTVTLGPPRSVGVPAEVDAAVAMVRDLTTSVFGGVTAGVCRSCLFTWPLRMSSESTELCPLSATAVPLSAANSATQAMIIAGDGCRLQIPFIGPSSNCLGPKVASCEGDRKGPGRGREDQRAAAAGEPVSAPPAATRRG